MESLNLSTALSQGRGFRDKISSLSGVNFTDCYQCGKCTAGCPVAFAMDYTPRQIMRLMQLGLKEEALKSHSIWLCASCETCYARCPKEIDLAKVMETIRIEAKEMGYRPEKTIDLFNDLFLASVEKYGRVHEMSLIVNFNLKSGQLFKDVGMGPQMLQKGKIHLLAEKIQDNGAVKRIFENVRNMGGDAE